METLTGMAARLRDSHSRQAPEENGLRLATIPRRDGDELRVNWSEYKDHNFVNLRVWREGSEGQWFPVKEMGLTIRLAELADFAEGIGKAVELATAAPQATAQAHEAPATHRPRKRSRRPTGLKNAPVAIPFDDDISGIGA